MTRSHWIDSYVEKLNDIGYTNSLQVCRWIAEHVLATRLPPHLAFPELTTKEKHGFDTCFKRILQGEPLQYVLGSTDFYNCTIMVGPGVLIPRPETEQLVELALQCVTGTGNVLDLCTGSGCIALAMAAERPDIPEIIGVDISPDALDWAYKNLSALDLKNVSFKQSDLFDAVAGHRFEVITSNPPYVAMETYEFLPEVVKNHEPERALFAEKKGLEILEKIILTAPDYLTPDGWLLCEIGADQGQAVRSLFESAEFKQIQIVKDYAGLDRIARGQKV